MLPNTSRVCNSETIILTFSNSQQYRQLLNLQVLVGKILTLMENFDNLDHRVLKIPLQNFSNRVYLNRILKDAVK